MGAEKRRRKRYAIQNSTVEYKKGGMLAFLKSSTHKFLILNINESGLSFIAREPLTAGDSLLLTVEAPKSDSPISARGKVAWVKKSEKHDAYRVGVNFTRLQGRSRSLLKNLLDNAVLEHIDISTQMYLREIEKL